MSPRIRRTDRRRRQAAADQLRADAERDAKEIRARGRARASGRRPGPARRERSLEDARRAADHPGPTPRAKRTSRASRRGEPAPSTPRRRRRPPPRPWRGRAPSAGLRRLGRSLGSQADTILRDVQAADQRMQADLRVGASTSPSRARTSPSSGRTPPRPTPCPCPPSACAGGRPPLRAQPSRRHGRGSQPESSAPPRRRPRRTAHRRPPAAGARARPRSQPVRRPRSAPGWTKNSEPLEARAAWRWP